MSFFFSLYEIAIVGKKWENLQEKVTRKLFSGAVFQHRNFLFNFPHFFLLMQKIFFHYLKVNS
jgi:hypothetical protein